MSVCTYQNNDLDKYTFGLFEDVEVVKKTKIELREKGFENAFVVGLFRKRAHQY